MAASKKAAFYEELERLDCTTDDDDAGARDRDGAEFERLLRASRKEAVLPQGLECQDAPMGRVERRACAVPEESPQQVVVDLVEEPTVRPSSSSGQHRDESSAIATTRPRLAGLLSDSLEPLVPKKRRRRQSAALKLMPEEQQIFKDFTFFFFPNNDISPLRRLRIRRAREYGATWSKQWNSHVTHVIVDKALSLEDVLVHLHLDFLPTEVAVVNETYPSECIKFRSVLSPSHSRFAVQGVSPEAPGVAKLRRIGTGDGNSLGSPSWTPVSKRRPSLPSARLPSKGSSSSLLTVDRPVLTAKREMLREDRLGRDELDTIIDATKAVKHLVN